jgi:putative acyl-CoA dehydrogenase
VMCLDVLRALERIPRAAEILLDELDAVASMDKRLDCVTERLRQRLFAKDREGEAQARSLSREIVLAIQAALLIEHAPPAVADGFLASRFGAAAGCAFGLLPHGVDVQTIVRRASPWSR